jgi:hypothetical protein
MAKITLDENWYLTSDGHRFKEGDPFDGFLWKLKGQEVDEGELESYPLAETKAVHEPPHTKAVKHKSTKNHDA